MDDSSEMTREEISKIYSMTSEEKRSAEIEILKMSETDYFEIFFDENAAESPPEDGYPLGKECPCGGVYSFPLIKDENGKFSPIISYGACVFKCNKCGKLIYMGGY